MEWFRTRSNAKAQSIARRAGRPRVRAILRNGPALDRAALAFASTLFTGFLPVGGLWGAIVGTLIAAFLPSPLVSALLLGAVTVVGTVAVTRVQRSSGVEDPSEVTIDEVSGAWLACLLSGLQGPALFLPFALFCLFDATKPLPANFLDRTDSAFGVMGDDLVAGFYGGLLARVTFLVWSSALPMTVAALPTALAALAQMAALLRS
jgi:phosphatidylglycerophosphatase A